MHIAWATKGFEADSGKLPHQVAREVLGAAHPGAVLSGPTFAREVGAGLPTAMTIASPDAAYAQQLAAELSSASFRAYTSTDILGVEIGGAVKNALAVGAGLSDGLGFGANTRVALITRGLREMTRLGVALGARAETFMGLAGLGDLVLTCTDDQSRNRRFGLLLARGLTARGGAGADRPGGRGLCRRARDPRRRRARARGDAAVRDGLPRSLRGAGAAGGGARPDEPADPRGRRLAARFSRSARPRSSSVAGAPGAVAARSSSKLAGTCCSSERSKSSKALTFTTA